MHDGVRSAWNGVLRDSKLLVVWYNLCKLGYFRLSQSGIIIRSLRNAFFFTIIINLLCPDIVDSK